MVRILSFTLAIWCFVVGVVAAFERPVISIHHPQALHDGVLPEKYANSANVSVEGTIKPPIGKSVTVRIYQVLDDGSLIRQIGVNTPVHDGKFDVNIDPPSSGWLAGQMRVEVALGAMPQVKSSVDLTVVPPAIVPKAANFHPRADSGIVLDLETSRGTTVPIAPNQLFLIRGQFEREGIESKLEGPHVGANLALEPVGDKKGIQYGSFGSVSLRKIDGKPSFEYEVQLLAPRQPGVYSVRVKPQFIKGVPAMPDFMLDVTQPTK